MADAKEPYGSDASYADPGYQKDGKKRYPLDNPGRVRSAISYFSQPSNYRRYDARQRELIRSRIRRAAKKFKIELDKGF